MRDTEQTLDGLAAALGEALRRRGWRLATAESCTGGWIAKVMTDIAGSSEWFDRGFVTYSNQAKQDMLGVRPETLLAHGAVSEAVARQMATGALERSGSDLAVAVTGIAGPGGGSTEKPVGTVWFAWAWREGEVRVESHCFDGDRETVRRASVVRAIERLIRLVDEVKQ